MILVFAKKRLLINLLIIAVIYKVNCNYTNFNKDISENNLDKNVNNYNQIKNNTNNGIDENKYANEEMVKNKELRNRRTLDEFNYYDNNNDNVINKDKNIDGVAQVDQDKNNVTGRDVIIEEPCVGDEQFCNLTKEEYIRMIENYIYPQTYEWALIATHSLVFVIGLIGNMLVCIAVYRNHTMRTVTNYFIVNLALADFMVILFCLPPTVLWDVTETWFLGDAMCKFLLYFQVSLVSLY